MRFKLFGILLCFSLLLLPGCKGSEPVNTPEETAASPICTLEMSGGKLQEAYVDSVELDIQNPEDEAVTMTEAKDAALPDILEPVASGELVMSNDKIIIDYSNTADGYAMICFTGETQRRLKVQIKCSTTYTYDLTPGEWAVFPLTDGNGHYQFKVFENVTGNHYSLVGAVEHDVVLTDEFAPFLRPNQYVNYSDAVKTVEKAWELTKDIDNPLGKVEAVYKYVVTELTYDQRRAATVKSGYIPVLDSVLEEKKGICFDYVALITGMLRSQGIPCKMVFGYVGKDYHAWISVWTEDTGWIDGVIFFDGVAWQRLDPTFANYDDQSGKIIEYISEGVKYSEKYFY